ncbi:MAG: RNA-binding domain-containing protein [Sulfolobales archaeon]
MIKIVLELSAFVHSTEDEEKVLSALLNTVPAELRSSFIQQIRTQSLEGYYGNIIKLVKLLVGRSTASNVLKHVLCSMSKTDREILLSTLESRVESRRTRLHIRLSKQDLYLGRVVLSEGSDVIKVVASFEGAHHVDLSRVLREIGETCGS